jgi:excinuclease ABC subunit C
MLCSAVFKALFDEKFGVQLVVSAPTSPGVYRYSNEDGVVLYVGKAKNLRRRLANYRNATRKKVHRKLRTLVQQARSLEYELCATEEAALLRENELIAELRPAYNVDGAFAFLYPALGLARWDKHTLLCFTTHPERFADLAIDWYGCFRSRPRAKAAFEALIALLDFVAHREKATRLPDYPRIKGSRLVGWRQLPPDLQTSLPAFFAGEHNQLLKALALKLLSKPRALQQAAEVQAQLDLLLHFFQTDAVRLREALASTSKTGTFIAQDERDALFIRAATKHA